MFGKSYTTVYDYLNAEDPQQNGISMLNEHTRFQSVMQNTFTSQIIQLSSSLFTHCLELITL